MLHFFRSAAPEVAKGVSVGLIVLSVSTLTSGTLQLAARALGGEARVEGGPNSSNGGSATGTCREPLRAPATRHVEGDPVAHLA